MKVIGLTGGIGSGKTTVAKMFGELGVPVYIADFEAKRLTNSSTVIKKKLIKLLGHSAYIDGKLNRKFVANIIFNDPKLLKKVNEIIHPKVASHFKRWVKRQNGNYCINASRLARSRHRSSSGRSSAKSSTMSRIRNPPSASSPRRR